MPKPRIVLFVAVKKLSVGDFVGEAVALETLELRAARQAESAARLADLIAGHPAVTRTIYPGRPDHPQYELAQRQMACGGTMIAFDVAGGKEAAFNVCRALSLVRISNNLGDAKSLIHAESFRWCRAAS